VDTHLYRTMFLIRAFEEQLPLLARQGLIRGSVHYSTGQEAVAAGVCAVLTPQDAITSTHRPLGHSLAKGLGPDRILAELLGRATGTGKGKGGVMHVADLSLGHLGANGIVGAGVPMAVGAALGFQQLGLPHVAVAFFGDGAMNQGALHEAFNLAAVWRLPVLFVCENNQHGLATSIEEASAQTDLVSRAVAYKMAARRVDGMDVRSVREATTAAVARARSGDGPTLLVMEICRADSPDWARRDPLAQEHACLLDQGLASAAELAAIEAGVEREVEAAVAFAIASPDPGPEELYTDVYAGEVSRA
jgi:acetoin:2,6-dichlorophenolindophenol oxidoreductase subunit alpha